MLLFAIIYVAGKLGGAVGPLQGTYIECLRMTELQEIDWDNAWKEKDLDHSPIFVHDGVHLTRKDIVIKCEYRDKAPDVDQ